MKTLVIWNRKGGVGKTTLATHLAWFFAEQNRRVLFLDLDQQGNGTDMLRSHAVIGTTPALFANDTDMGASFQATDDLIDVISGGDGVGNIERKAPRDAITSYRKNIREIKGPYDICIVDAPPGQNLTVLATLVVANFVIAPFDLGQAGIDGVKQVRQTVRKIKESHNPNLTFLGALAWRLDGRVASQKQLIDALNESYPGLLLPGTISQRAATAACGVTREPVWKDKSAREAGAEMLAVMDVIARKVYSDGD